MMRVGVRGGRGTLWAVLVCWCLAFPGYLSLTWCPHVSARASAWGGKTSVHHDHVVPGSKPAGEEHACCREHFVKAVLTGPVLDASRTPVFSPPARAPFAQVAARPRPVLAARISFHLPRDKPLYILHASLLI